MIFGANRRSYTELAIGIYCFGYKNDDYHPKITSFSDILNSIKFKKIESTRFGGCFFNDCKG